MNFQLQPATLEDVPQLVLLEQQSFSTDLLSARSFRSLIKAKRSTILVAIASSSKSRKLAAYAMVLYHRGTALARLYSIAVSPNYRGHGLASTLLSAVEKEAAETHHCAILRLEVRPDNAAAIQLYERHGYRRFKVKRQYYEDDSDALCYEKKIVAYDRIAYRQIPYYQQNLDFTCGPSCLIMAMKSFRSEIKGDLGLELEIWREATTIFMTSGHGGCGPHGLALAAWKRGFRPEIILSQKEPLFLRSVRGQHKRRVLEIVHKDFNEHVQAAQIQVKYKPLTLKKIDDALNADGVPVVLISSYAITKTKIPHWVVICGHDEHYLYIHDPDYETEPSKNMMDLSYVPVKKSLFLKMARFGGDNLQAMVVIYNDRVII